MKSKKKTIAAAVAVSVILFLTPLVVFALMLKSAERSNQFHPAKQDIAIAENQGKPAETQENEIEWSETTNAVGNHVAVKEVSVNEISNPNGEYLRVRLVPSWYDSSGCVVSGIEDVTDICSAKIDGNTLVFMDSGGTKTIVTVNLAENWNTVWKPMPNVTDVQYFETLQPINSRDEKLKLVSSVEISDTVLQTANTNNIFLRLDVLADSIQSVENNNSTTENPKW